MTIDTGTSIESLISPAGLQKIDQWIDKYPSDRKQSAVISALMVVQDELGYLTEEAMTAVAAYLDIAPVAVFEVANFYTMYEKAPVGRHVISVCKSISCHLNNYQEILKHLEKKLKIKVGETTEDNRFTLRCAECLGACVNAPMMQVNKEYHEQLSISAIDDILDLYK